MSWSPHPALQAKETLHSLAAGSSWAVLWMRAHHCILQSLADVWKPSQEPSGTQKSEAAAFSFSAAVLSAVTCGREKPFWGWSPQGASRNTRTGPDEPGSISGVGRRVLHSQDTAQPGHCPACPACPAQPVPGAVSQGMGTPHLPLWELSGLDTSSNFPSHKASCGWAVWGYFSSKEQLQELPCPELLSLVLSQEAATFHAVPTTDPSVLLLSAETLPALSIREFWKTRLDVSPDNWDACH